MECVMTSIVRPLLSKISGALSGAVAKLLSLEENAEALLREMELLSAGRRDLENKIEIQEMQQPGMARTSLATKWLANIDNLEEEVCCLEEPLAGRRAFLEGCSFGSLRSDWVLGRKVEQLLKRVRELKGQQADVESRCMGVAPPAPAVHVKDGAPLLVGRGEALSTIRGYLTDEKVGMVGIYGMGGVGKTTLLTEINQQFVTEPSHKFDVVIFVNVSREVDVSKIQEDIGIRLGFPRGSLPIDEDDRRGKLYKALDQKKFLLLLDDLWKPLNLENIGIPDPNISSNKGKKILFTTRQEEVCTRMAARQPKVKVHFLDLEESWELFKSNLDVKVDLGNHAIRECAEVVMRKCGGLPLALITIGRAMSNKTQPAEWRQTKKKLERSPDEIQGMEDVLSLLKFSFDELKDDVTKECLLYCALAPEDHVIEIDQLVSYWLGEGFLDDGSSKSVTLADARDKGVWIIGVLKEACLLESGGCDDDTTVKMHDVVREMALWLTGGKFDKMKRFIICEQGEKHRLTQLEEVEAWEVAGRISINKKGTLELPSPEFQCHNLETLLISGEFAGYGGVQIKQTLCIRQSFWESMSVLRVLDLSGTDIEELPDAFGHLANLHYLDLSLTPIRQLSKQLGNLVNLRYLSLACTWDLEKMPREATIGLSKLQKLELYRSGHQWCGDSSGLKLTDIERHLPRLEELSLTIDSLPLLEELANSEILRKCSLTLLQMEYVKDLTSPRLYTILQRLQGLQHLEITHNRDWDWVNWEIHDEPALHGGPVLDRPHFQSLRTLEISRCPWVTDVSWVGQLRNLESLHLSMCGRLEQILVSDGEGEVVAADDDAFPELRTMILWNLDSLRAISTGRPLRFPSLERLKVHGCPNLRRLPLGSQSCPKIKEIIAHQSWWDALEWDDYDDDSGSSGIRSRLPVKFQWG